MGRKKEREEKRQNEERKRGVGEGECREEGRGKRKGKKEERGREKSRKERRREKRKVWKGRENYVSLASCQEVCLDLYPTHVCMHMYLDLCSTHVCTHMQALIFLLLFFEKGNFLTFIHEKTEQNSSFCMDFLVTAKACGY